MPIGDTLSSTFDNGVLVEQVVVTAEDATTRTVEVRNGQGAPLRTVVVPRNIEGENRETIAAQARTALNTNRTFIANASPTNAEVVAQVRALSRQNNGLIRLMLGLLDGTN